MTRRDTQAVAAGIDHLVMWARRQAPTQVSTSTITTLDTLHAEGPLRISQLAEREAVSQPGMTTLIDRLEAAGQAERVPDPSDRRATLVRITELGVKVLAARQADRTAALAAELERLDDADRAALIAALPAVRRLVGRQKGSRR
ncbi:MAG TPA: MarR family transcriptional regulator [Acidothermaceae bacterium]|jgi:DNA-binding MarR family transcriptional regulator